MKFMLRVLFCCFCESNHSGIAKSDSGKSRVIDMFQYYVYVGMLEM